MVQKFRRLIFAANINNDIAFSPDFGVSGSDYFGIFEFVDIVFEHGASQGLIAMETAIVGAYFHRSQ